MSKKITSLANKKIEKQDDIDIEALAEARLEVYNSIRECCNALIDSGLSNFEVIGMLFDLQNDYRESMYEE